MGVLIVRAPLFGLKRAPDVRKLLYGAGKHSSTAGGPLLGLIA